MAFKRKTDTTSGEQYKFDAVGQQLTGYYLGSHDHDGDYGPTKKHLFKTAKGVKVVFGQRHLTDLLAGEAIGTLMQITYVGDKKMKKGNPMKQYTLDIDTDNTLDSDEVTAAQEASQESEEGGTAGFDEEPSEIEDEEPPMDEVKTAPVKKLVASANAAAAKTRVQEILSKRQVKN